jgi:hypothetical protein
LPRKLTTNLDSSKVLKCLLAATTDHIAKRPGRPSEVNTRREDRNP